MTTTTSTFTPSTQILEAGEQAQALADAGKALKPFLPEEAQQTIEGVEKVANALNATGQALKHFGFDEAEPELVTTASDVELIPTDEPVITDHMNFTPSDLIPDNLRPSTGVIAAGQTLQELGLNGPGAAVEGAGQIMRSFGFDEDETDPITSVGQTMDTDDDDLGAIFTIGALIGGAIMGAKAAAAAAAAKAAAAALAAKALAGGVVAGAKAVTAGQIGGAIVTGAVSGAASYGVSKAMGADIDSDEGLVQPWMPEVGVDVWA